MATEHSHPKTLEEMSSVRKRSALPFFYNSGKFQAAIKDLVKCVYPGLEFGYSVHAPGVSLRKVTYKITKITNKGMARIKYGDDRVGLHKIALKRGFPVLVNAPQAFPLYDPLPHNITDQYYEADARYVASLFQRGTDQFVGRRFVDTLGQVRKIWYIDPANLFAICSDRRGPTGKLIQFDPVGPIYIVHSSFETHTERCCGGHTKESFIWKQDFSYEMTIVCSLQNYCGLPREIAHHVLDYWLFNDRQLEPPAVQPAPAES